MAALVEISDELREALCQAMPSLFTVFNEDLDRMIEAVAPALIREGMERALEPFSKAQAMGFEGNMLKLPFETADELHAAMDVLRQYFEAIRSAAKEV